MIEKVVFFIAAFSMLIILFGKYIKRKDRIYTILERVQYIRNCY